MLKLKPLANALTVLQFNSLLSDLCHIQSSSAFETVLKIHPYKQHIQYTQLKKRRKKRFKKVNMLVKKALSPVFVRELWCDM